MDKILITGSSGFVGSWLVEEALERHLKTYAGIRESSSKKFLQHPKTEFTIIDFKDKAALKALLLQHQFDYVIHNAGVVRALTKDSFYQVNAGYTETLVTLLRETTPRLKKFALMSSIAACGPADNLPEQAVSSDMELNPVTHYGRSKVQAELAVRDSGLKYLIFRPTAVYGPRDQDIFLLFKGVKTGIAPLIGMKESKTTFVYVKDLVRVIVEAITSDVVNKTYVVSDGSVYVGDDFHKAVSEVMGKQAIYPRVPLPIVTALAALTQLKSKLTNKADTFDLDKVNELKPRNWNCNISELKKDFNFEPQLTLSETLSETYQWYKDEGWI